VINDVVHNDLTRNLLTQIKRYEWVQLLLVNQNNQKNMKFSLFFFPLLSLKEHNQENTKLSLFFLSLLRNLMEEIEKVAPRIDNNLDFSMTIFSIAGDGNI